MEKDMSSFRAALSAENLKLGDEYAIHGTLAYAMQWGDANKEGARKKISRAFQPVKDSIQKIAGIKKGSRWSPSRATLETIVTKIFPLLEPMHPTLQYWIDMWHRDHPQDHSTQRPREDQSSPPAFSLNVANEEAANATDAVILQRAVLPDSFDATLAGEPFDPSRARNVIYRQEWLTAQVRAALHQDRRPHLMKNNREALYNCLDLIAAAIPTSRQNVNVKVWPRLLESIDGETTNPFVVHLRQNWERVQMNDDDGWMTIPEFDEFMWRALATGQPKSIPAMIRNADTLNGYATGVGSTVAHVENERLHVDYATNATAEQRIHLQRRANQAEQVMDPFLRPELQGARTGPLGPQSVTHEANLRLQLELFQADPAARIAEAESKARIAEAESKAKEAEAEERARTAEAEGRAREEEAKAKVNVKKAEWDAKKAQQERKFEIDKEMLERRSTKRVAIGLRATAPSSTAIDLTTAVPGVPNQYKPQSAEEIVKISFWNTFVKAGEKHAVEVSPVIVPRVWLKALAEKRVPDHEKYDQALIAEHTPDAREFLEAKTIFKRMFPGIKYTESIRKADTLAGYDHNLMRGGMWEGWKGLMIRDGAHWKAT